MNRFLTLSLALALSTSAAHATELVVDRGGSTPYKTLAAAAASVQPGDTIRVKPDSGPYREPLWIKTSGTADKPIVFDGGGNAITAFDPLTAWEVHDGVTTCHISNFPCVITYKGERLRQDYATGQFTKYADLNAAQDTLTLRPGSDTAGWEISKRAFAVHIANVSHHIYRNVRATGSTNDGFNLHGNGTDLVFENVEGFNNFDEGFSTHDSIQSVVRNSKFYWNDNGIANSYVDKVTVSTTLINVDLHDNLGFGLVLHDCAAKLDNVRIWNSGVRQVNFMNAVIDCNKVNIYTPPYSLRPWRSYTESKLSNVKAPATPYLNVATQITGTPPVVETASAPAGMEK